MKKLVLLVVMLLALAVSAHAKKNPWDQNMPIKEGAVFYSISGTEKGTKELYIRDYGRYTAIYEKTAMKVMGTTHNRNTITIADPDWVYSIDLVEGTAVKTINPVKCMIEEFNKLSSSDKKKAMANAEKMGLAAMKDMNGKVTKNAATILGFKCDKAEMMGVTTYIASGSGLELKSTANLMGVKSETTATKVDKGSVSSDKFKVPSKYKVTYDKRTDQMIRDNAKMSVAMLVSGETPTAGFTAPKSQDGGQQMPSEAEMKKMMKMFGGQ